MALEIQVQPDQGAERDLPDFLEPQAQLVSLDLLDLLVIQALSVHLAREVQAVHRVP